MEEPASGRGSLGSKSRGSRWPNPYDDLLRGQESIKMDTFTSVNIPNYAWIPRPES